MGTKFLWGGVVLTLQTLVAIPAAAVVGSIFLLIGIVLLLLDK